MFISISSLLTSFLSFHLLFSAVDAYSRPTRLRRNYRRQFTSSSGYNGTESYKALTVELPLDHFDGNPGTFKNRYWVDASMYKSGGPVILDDWGESNAEPQESSLEQDLAYNTAKANNGLLILWEHRYYGKSLPEMDSTIFDDSGAMAEWYKYLTVDQALEDVVSFASNFSYAGIDDDLGAGATPWIFVGSSYSGARAAWIRQRNPDVVYISLASSGPVNVQTEFPEYMGSVKDYMESHGYANCSTDVGAWFQWMDKVVSDEDTSSYESFTEEVSEAGTGDDQFDSSFKTRQLWNGYSDQEDMIQNFNEYTQFMPGYFQYYGIDDGIAEFCDYIQLNATGSLDNSDSSDNTELLNPQTEKEGIFSALGTDAALKVMAEAAALYGYGSYGFSAQEKNEDEASGRRRHPKHRNIPLKKPSMNVCTSDDMECAAYSLDQNQTSWTWQFCSELGYLEVANLSDPGTLAPAWQNKTYYETNYCFNGADPDLLPQQEYGGFKGVNPSNTFFVDGEWDPWRQLSLNSPQSGRTATQDIPAANEKLTDGKFFGYIVKDRFHAAIEDFPGTFDNSTSHKLDIDTSTAMYIDEASVNAIQSSLKAQQMFLDAVDLWLKDFKPHRITSAGKKPAKPTNTGVSSASASPTSTAASGKGGNGDDKGTGSTAEKIGIKSSLSLSVTVILALLWL